MFEQTRFLAASVQRGELGVHLGKDGSDGDLFTLAPGDLDLVRRELPFPYLKKRAASTQLNEP
ncbi:MAG TPA: hypothetical protein VK176_14225, partial [Phycisphaerales bacterium]|nr:hypothetical protein [Phycisphaerales bacterium]